MKDEALGVQGKDVSAKYEGKTTFRIKSVAKVKFPTKYGIFDLYGFEDGSSPEVNTVLVKGNVRGVRDCPVRVHSECHTGDVFGSLRCDCREQLEASLRYVSEQECGAVLYMRQEGRGIGLSNKLKAYSLQDSGFDTVEANELLGLPAEARQYDFAAAIIRYLGMESIILLTNNPDKIEKLTEAGIVISGRYPVVIDSNEHNRAYLTTKKLRMRHLL
jgi:GTP cyclohydrolase II